VRPIALFVFALFVAACATPTPPTTVAPIVQYATFSYDVIDAVTSHPVEAQVTIRRERLDGSLIDELPTYTGQHIEMDVPVDSSAKIFILVEAEGYEDWERAIVVEKPSKVSGPIRLSPLPTITPTLEQEANLLGRFGAIDGRKVDHVDLI